MSKQAMYFMKLLCAGKGFRVSRFIEIVQIVRGGRDQVGGGSKVTRATRSATHATHVETSGDDVYIVVSTRVLDVVVQWIKVLLQDQLILPLW